MLLTGGAFGVRSRLQHGGRSADWQHMVSTNSSFPLIQPVDARPATAPLQAQAQAASVPQFPSPILSQRGELQQLPQTMSFSMQDGTFLNTGSFQQPTQQQTDLPASAHAALQQLDPVQQRDFATLLQVRVAPHAAANAKEVLAGVHVRMVACLSEAMLVQRRRRLSFC